MPCGRFFDGLIEDYAAHAPDVLIVNVLRYRDNLSVDHLTFDEARRVYRRGCAESRSHDAFRHEDARTQAGRAGP